MELLLNGATTGGQAGKFVKDGNSRSFVQDVIEASADVPVIVDFGTPRSQPCKIQTQLLEKLVNGAGGAVRLVKVNVDQNPELAQQIRIQSVPTVYAFKDGRPIDGFTGQVTEAEIKAFIGRLTGDKAAALGLDESLADAKGLLEEGDVAQAAALYQDILAQDPENVQATAGLLRCLVAARETAKAKALLASLPEALTRHADIAAVKAAIELAEQAKAAGPVDALRQKVAANPLDHQARLDLALACFAAGDHEAAVDEVIELFRRDRAWNDGAARKQLVKFIEAFGPGNPLATSARRRLSSLMFS